MSEDVSGRLGLPYLAPGQAQKEVTHNEALQRLDMLVQAVVESADLSVPPPMPEDGACWIVATGGSGAWAGRDGHIAQWTGGGWRFARPSPGWRCEVLDRQSSILRDGSGWVEPPVRPDGLYVSGIRVVGGQQSPIDNPSGGSTADGEAREAISQILAVLRAHGLISA